MMDHPVLINEDSTFGLFEQELPEDVYVARCGLCRPAKTPRIGTPFADPHAKASHLRRMHDVTVRETVGPTGVPMYEWTR